MYLMVVVGTDGYLAINIIINIGLVTADDLIVEFRLRF